MRKLWKVLPPLMADNFGFIEMIRQTDGIGIIDDCGEYRLGRERRGGPDTRVCHTEISSEDVVSGTRQKVLDAFEKARERYRPKFALLSAGPCSAMIGTDLDEAAEEIGRKAGIPAAAVKLSGHKTYDVGISETLYGMAVLLCEKQEVIPDSVNLLGANSFDWGEEMAEKIRDWFEGQGLSVIANLGGNETAMNIRRMPAASVNLVLTVSGLKTAKYLYRQFGTPYLTTAPFGEARCRRLLQEIKGLEQERVPVPDFDSSAEDAQMLIIGEQFMTNAIRETLMEEYGIERIQTASFYQLSKELAASQDVRIRDEQDARKLLWKCNYQIIIGAPLLRALAPGHIKWVNLPHRVFSLYGEAEGMPVLFGRRLNEWLKREGAVK